MSIFVELPPDDYSETAFVDFTAAASFDPGTARALMWASQLAYETHQQATIDAVRQKWRFPSILPFHATARALGTEVDTRGIIAKRADVTIVAFAGTDPAVLANVITDAEVIPEPGTDIHDGFSKALDAIWPSVSVIIAQSVQPVMFAGHSLGAALAVLGAMRFVESGGAPLAVYTYGLPRVGGARFIAAYNGRLGLTTYRFVHGNDIVPTVPMSALGFRHVGRMMQCASDGSFKGTALSGLGSDEPNFSVGLRQGIATEFGKLLRGELGPAGPGRIGKLLEFLPAQIRDHLPDRYIAALAP
jgi:triacylglycerol lipase